MTELLRNAWLGWGNYIDDGKLAALLLAVILFLWLYGKRVEYKSLVLYTTVMTVCCIVPVTAALLMMYQTRFYDYEWIWSLVPVTAVTAYGITICLAEYWKDFKVAQWRKAVPVTLLLLAAILFCSGMGKQAWDKEAQNAERQQAYGVVEKLLEQYPDEDICLWAPREVMEYAREADARIRLPYGRNMRDISLNGYAYDTYDEATVELYQWMEQSEESLSLTNCVQNAKAMGVNCILLPEAVELATVQEMEKAFGVKAQLLEEYWIFYGRAD